MIFTTVTAIKTPFVSLNTNKNHKHFFDPFSSFFNPVTLDWKYGYGDLSSDNIPDTLQPKYVLSFNSLLNDNIKDFLLEHKLDINQAHLYVYNHNVAIIVLNFNIPNSSLFTKFDSEFDQAVSQLLNQVYELSLQYLFNLFQGNHELAHTAGIELDTSLNHHISSKSDDYVLWTARYLQLNNQNKTNNNVLRWCNCRIQDLSGDPDFSYYIGSGNGVVFSPEPNLRSNDFLKTILLPQFYYAFLSIYNETFETSLKDFAYFDKKIFSPKRQIDHLLSQTQNRIEIQEYLSLSVSDAIRGTQGIRSNLLKHVFENWRIKELEIDSAKKSNFLHKKLDTWMNRILQKQNRTIETVLALMGGIALIDFVLSLLVSAPDLTERSINTFSLIGLFNQVSADKALYLAFSLLFFLLTYIYFKRK